MMQPLQSSPADIDGHEVSEPLSSSRAGERNNTLDFAVGPATWRLVTIRTGIAVYWLMMFLGTHLPVQQVVEQLPTTDKHLHLLSYGLLGAALPWWSSRPPAASGRGAAWLVVLVLTYGAIDEWLQIPVGRTAEWGDWLADAAGTIVGVTAGSSLRRWISRSGPACS